jgi:hypothetical protein
VAVHQTITVRVPAGPPSTTVVVASATTSPSPAAVVGGTLPRTGAPFLPLLVWTAILLILVGRLLLGLSRRLRPDGEN